MGRASNMTAPHKYNTPESLERYQHTLEATDRIVEFLEQRKLEGQVTDYEVTEVSDGAVYLYVYVPKDLFWDFEQRGILREAVQDFGDDALYVQAVMRPAA
jgi:hypothetical protein